MATNFFFQSGIPGGRSSEQLLMEDIIIECLKIYGFDTYYIPRVAVNEDYILGEDVLNKYSSAYPLEMYMQNVTGFEGVQLPGGVTLNGQKIFDEAMEEIKELKDEVRSTYELPVDFFTG